MIGKSRPPKKNREKTNIWSSSLSLVEMQHENSAACVIVGGKSAAKRERSPFLSPRIL